MCEICEKADFRMIVHTATRYLQAFVLVEFYRQGKNLSSSTLVPFFE